MKCVRQGLTKCLQATAVDSTERSFGTGQLKLTVTPWPKYALLMGLARQVRVKGS